MGPIAHTRGSRPAAVSLPPSAGHHTCFSGGPKGPAVRAPFRFGGWNLLILIPPYY
jgi:hypothetical protein